jgi:hypothetical protein
MLNVEYFVFCSLYVYCFLVLTVIGSVAVELTC